MLRSANIEWRQKLDAIVELALPAPVIHLLAAAASIAAALALVQGQPGWWIAGFAAASMSGIFVTTIVAIRNHPQRWRTLASFFMLPVYAFWRLAVAVRTVATVRDTRWHRTGRVGGSVHTPLPMTDPPG